MLLTVTRQAEPLARDMLHRYMLRFKDATMQRDLLHGISVYMAGSCRTQVLHIIHISAGFLGRCSSKKPARDSLCRAVFLNSNITCSPGSQQSRVCWEQPCLRSCSAVAVVFLCFYLRRGCRAAVTLPAAARVNAEGWQFIEIMCFVTIN